MLDNTGEHDMRDNMRHSMRDIIRDIIVGIIVDIIVDIILDTIANIIIDIIVDIVVDIIMRIPELILRRNNPAEEPSTIVGRVQAIQEQWQGLRRMEGRITTVSYESSYRYLHL
jgi:hypothetical protein